MYQLPATIRTVDSSILRKLPRIQWIVYLNSTDPSKNILQYSEYNFFSHEKQQIQVIQIVHDKAKQIARKTVQLMMAKFTFCLLSVGFCTCTKIEQPC